MGRDGSEWDGCQMLQGRNAKKGKYLNVLEKRRKSSTSEKDDDLDSACLFS